MNKKNLIIGAVALLVLVGGYFTFFNGGVGGTTNFSDLSVDSLTNAGTLTQTGALTVGSSGSSLARINRGVCNIHAGANTIAATSTIQLDCQAGTGVLTALSNIPAWTAGDTVFVQQSTSTPTAISGLNLLGASASTTAGYITVRLANTTGTTYTWTAAASSSWQYLFIR